MFKYYIPKGLWGNILKTHKHGIKNVWQVIVEYFIIESVKNQKNYIQNTTHKKYMTLNIIPFISKDSVQYMKN